MPVTMKDVAKIAGVHQSTVSLVLTDDPRISKDTKVKVLETAKRLNYKRH